MEAMETAIRIVHSNRQAVRVSGSNPNGFRFRGRAGEVFAFLTKESGQLVQIAFARPSAVSNRSMSAIVVALVF